MAPPSEPEPSVAELEHAVSELREQVASERRRARESLRSGTQALDSILNACPDAILLLDAEGTVLAANAAVGRGLGVMPEALVGACIYDQFPEPIGAQRRRVIESVVRSGRPARVEDEHFGRYFDSSVMPLTDDDGRVTRVAIYSHNVTEQRRSLRAERLQALGALATGIAHDFNNILTPIANLVELLKRPDLDAAQRHDLIERVEQAILRAAGVVGQILAFSRDAPARPVRVDLADLTREVLGLVQASFASITTEFVAPDTAAATFGDPGQLHQALLNVCMNGAQAMQAAGTGTLRVEVQAVELSTKAALTAGLSEGRYVVLHVTDTGPGVPPEIQARVFDPFFTTKRPGEGSGIGLATAQAVVERHRGHIQVESRLGTGARFSLWFPEYRANVD